MTKNKKKTKETKEKTLQTMAIYKSSQIRKTVENVVGNN